MRVCLYVCMCVCVLVFDIHEQRDREMLFRPISLCQDEASSLCRRLVRATARGCAFGETVENARDECALGSNFGVKEQKSEKGESTIEKKKEHSWHGSEDGLSEPSQYNAATDVGCP